MQIHMEEASISKELLEGEELLWSGRPDPQGQSIVAPNKIFLIMGSVFLLTGLLFGIVGVLVLASLSATADASSSLGLFIPGGVFFFMGLGFLIGGFVSRLPAKNTLYAITDRRVLILCSQRYLRVTSYRKSDITQIQRIERPNGGGDLIFSGNAFPYGYPGNNAYNANTYYSGRQGVFNAVPEVHFVEQKLLEMLERK